MARQPEEAGTERSSPQGFSSCYQDGCWLGTARSLSFLPWLTLQSLQPLKVLMALPPAQVVLQGDSRLEHCLWGQHKVGL